MSTESEAAEGAVQSRSCVDCGKPVDALYAGIAICDECLVARGSCCQESKDFYEDGEAACSRPGKGVED